MKRKRRISKRRRKIEKWLANTIAWPALTLLGIAVLLALSPVLLLGLVVTGWFADRAKRSAAHRFRCTTCGVPLGVVALSLADAAYSEYWERLEREHPGVKFRIIRTLDAICPNCGQRYTYIEKEKTFTEETQERSRAQEEEQSGRTEDCDEWDGHTENNL